MHHARCARHSHFHGRRSAVPTALEFDKEDWGDMSAIHSPVLKYHKKVSKPVDAFMQRLSPPKPFWRANWAITDHPQLFQPLTEDDIT